MRQRTRQGADGTSSDNQDDDIQQIARSPAEQQPLLSTTTPPRDHAVFTDPLGQTRPSSTRRGSLALMALILAYAITLLLVNWSFDRLPTSRPVDASNKSTVFSGDGAWHHLQQFASKPHPINSRENDVSRAYLVKELSRLQHMAAEAGRTVQVEFENEEVYFGSDRLFDADMAGIPRNDPNTELGMFYHSRNLLLKIPGTETNKSIMFLAHYDSVPTSNGAADNGMAVAALLELIRALIHKPPTRHGLLFNINNGEEVGLLGSRAFMQHPWSKYVHSFINIDCGGVGGKPMVFQASGSDVLEEWAKTAPHSHGNVIANDLFAAGVIKSGTDYAVLQKRWPGIDMAFYERRGWYHTQKDSIESLTPNSLQYVGNNLLAYATKAANIDELSPPIIYCVLRLFGHVMIAGGYATYQCWNIALLVSAYLLVGLTVITHTRRTSGATIGSTLQLLKYSVLQTLFSMLVAVILCIVWSVALTFLNDLVIYRHPRWCLAIFVLVGVYAMDFSRYHRYYKPLNGKLRLAGLSIVWSLAVLLASFIAYKYRYGSLYYVQFGLIGSIAAMLYSELSEWRQCHRASGFIRLLLSAIIPAALFMDLTDMILVGFAPHMVDGLPAIALYIVLSVLATTITLPLMPFLPKRPINNESFQLQFVSILTLILLLLSNYSGNTPVKVMARQNYTPKNDTNIMSPSYSLSIDLTPNGYNKTISLARGRKWPSMHWTMASPKFKFWPPINMRAVKRYTGLVEIYAPESRYCYIQLPRAHPLAILRESAIILYGLESFKMSLSDDDTNSIDASPISLEAIQGQTPSDDWLVSSVPVTNAAVIRGRFEQPWAFRVIGGRPNDTIQVKCEFDDIELHSPSITKVRNMLPKWAQIWASGTGVLEVFQEIKL
ncbi:hypothetical protein BDF19DRAFT_434877 [Syncephalis fuscata]|nr:hypothetical protein BDF19DRAFT_434877 [Syncephalis fuscata]